MGYINWVWLNWTGREEPVSSHGVQCWGRWNVEQVQTRKYLSLSLPWPSPEEARWKYSATNTSRLPEFFFPVRAPDLQECLKALCDSSYSSPLAPVFWINSDLMQALLGFWKGPETNTIIGKDKNSWKFLKEFLFGPTAQSIPKHGPEKHTSQSRECAKRFHWCSSGKTREYPSLLVLSSGRRVALLVKLWHNKIVSALKYCRDKEQGGWVANDNSAVCLLEAALILAASSITQWETSFAL